ncbi:DUF3526 domain-containing protein [Aliikangiella maris]|uniref:DUF3526 domain-containing protein n=2 Tax=Aliikangiella maris TaxID=3162458 RepID=A0ABV3MTN3_9GAMM
MIFNILSHEWTTHRQSKLQIILLTLMISLLLLAMFIHWNQQQALIQSQQIWQEKADNFWRNQPDRHPHRVAHYGHVVLRPTAPLSFIDAGISPYVGNYLFLEAHRQNSSAIRNTLLSPTIMKLGYPSVSTLMIILWPLILIIIGYGSFSHERESERLKWLLSMGATIWQLFVGKSLLFIIYTILLLAIIATVTLFFLIFNNTLSLTVVIELFMLLIVYGLYSAFWIMLIFILSYRVQSSTTSLAGLLLTWLFTVVLIPKLSVELSENIYQTPDRLNLHIALEKAVKAIGDSHNPDDPYFTDFKSQVLKKYGVKSIAELPVNWKGLVMAEGERIQSEIYKTHFQAITDQYQQQQQVSAWFGFLSPGIAIHQLSQILTINDRISNHHFELAAEAFRYQLIQSLNEIQTHHIDYENNSTQKASQSFWQQMGLFNYQHPTLNERVNQASISWLILCFWVAVLLSGIIYFKKQWYLP